MPSYKRTQGAEVMLTSDGSDSVSYITPNGRGWDEYQQWISNGNTPDPPDSLPDPGPSQAEQVDALVASGAAALATASTLSDVKAVFAATLAGLGDLFGTGA